MPSFITQTSTYKHCRTVSRAGQTGTIKRLIIYIRTLGIYIRTLLIHSWTFMIYSRTLKPYNEEVSQENVTQNDVQ